VALDIKNRKKSRVRDRFISYSKYSRRGTFVVSSPFVKAEADSDRLFCTVFETVCASSLAMCAYQIEHLHLTFSDHLNLYSQQANREY
jgi:hypothetical protein